MVKDLYFVGFYYDDQLKHLIAGPFFCPENAQKRIDDDMDSPLLRIVKTTLPFELVE